MIAVFPPQSEHGILNPQKRLDDDSGRDPHAGAEGAETLRQTDWNLTNLWKAA